MGMPRFRIRTLMIVAPIASFSMFVFVELWNSFTYKEVVEIGSSILPLLLLSSPLLGLLAIFAYVVLAANRGDPPPN